MQIDKLFYLFIILLPAGLFLPFLSSAIIFVVPSVFFNMLAGSQRLRLIDFGVPGILPLPRHMSLMAAVFLFISAIYAIQRLRLIFARHSTLSATVFCLLLISMTAYSARFILHLDFYYKPPIPTSAKVKKVISLIPHEATVKTSIEIANHLYDRKEVYLLGSPVETDFIVFRAVNSVEAFRGDVKDKYKFVVLEKDIFLLKRK